MLMIRKLSHIIVVLTILFVAITTTANGQLATSTLLGSVADTTGSQIPNAQVHITNRANGSVRDITSNEAGLFNIPNLQPGTYDVKVDAPGFATLEEKGITLNVGAQQSVTFTLKIGQASETVEVTGSAPLVDSTSSTIGATVEQKTIVELPLNGRDWTQLATLQPGIVSVRAQASTGATANRGNRGFGDQLTDSGHRPNENTYRLDGININDYSNGAPGSTLGAALGVDAIQEFSVVTTNYTAEYGRTSGAVINAVTKSGTNKVHGTGYFFDRDKIFDARNFFDPVGKTPPFRRTQFGGSLGGPIRKNKTFLFGDYEGVRQGQSLSFSDHIFSQAALAGVMCSTPNGNNCVTHTIAIDPKIQPFLKLWQPAGGTDTGPTPGGNGDTDVLLTSGLKVLNENYYTARADNKFSDKDSVNATFFYDKAPLTQPDSLTNTIHEVYTERHTVAFAENHVFTPSVANIFRFGYTHVTGLVNNPVSAINPAAGDTTLCTVCTPALPASLINIDGLTSAGGLGYISFFGHYYDSFQANDDFFFTAGKHSIKVGVAFEHILYDLLAKVRANGSVNFTTLTNTPNVSGLENFLTNRPASILVLSPTVRRPAKTRDNLLGAYIQDDWRLSQRLTLNLGMRYEILTNPTDANGSFGLLSDLHTGTVTSYTNLFAKNPTLKDFDPRIGFAWDPAGDGKTSVRGGIGIFDILPLPYVYTIGDSLTLPNAVQVNAGNPSNPLPQGSFPVIPSSVNFGTSQGVRYVDRNPKRAYATNWNVSVEHELNSKIGLLAAYVGSRTLHAPFTADDSNQVEPQKINGLYTYPCTVTATNTCAPGSGALTNPNVGFIRAVFFDDAASYEGFQSQIVLRNVKSLQAQVAYTLGKCIDEGSGGALGDPFQNSLASLIYFDKRSRLGPCDFDIRHNVIANAIYTLPTPANWSHTAKVIAGGWQAGGIMNFSTGIPFSLILPGDPLGQNSTDAGYDYPNRVSGCNPIHGGINYVNTSCFVVAPITNGGLVLGNNGRNSLYGPKLFNVDFSVFKNFRMTETANLQLRAEFFNVLNHTNLQAPVDNFILFTGGAGQIDSTATSSRQIQFGAKIAF